MAVLNTTSAVLSPIAPKARPRKIRPSASANIASLDARIIRSTSGPVRFLRRWCRMDDFARHNSVRGLAFQPPAGERGIAAQRDESRRVNRPFEFRIDH